MLNFLVNTYIKCSYTQDHYIAILDNKIILNGKQNIKHDLKKSKHFSLKKFQTQFQILINHLMQRAMLKILALEQHYYNPTMEQIK